MKKKLLIALAVLVVLSIGTLIAGYFFLHFDKRVANIPDGSLSETAQKKEIPKLSTIAKNLEVPWSLAFLPDGSLMFTERPGRVRLINKDGNLRADPVVTIADVQAINEGGLLGIALHPKYSENNQIYFYYTFDAEKSLNRVVRFRYDGTTLVDQVIVVDEIPGAAIHNGGRIKFGPDGLLYIACGDAANPSHAQDKNSLAGKILRVTDEGKPAPDNPFGSEVYSWGHRNPQGLAWDDLGRLWATEHGQIATDELNLIVPGKNYGWPTIVGDQTQDGMENPVVHSGDANWAPSGAAFYKGSVFFTGLRGQALYEAVIDGDKVTIKEHLKGEVGRIRDVVVGPDEFLYISTSNRDGRNVPTADDDRILRVNPQKL
ncbi:MAG TPA: PQQ-dependent sugar dehydrogenase [Candidatus Nanoarchaeia archaeon]|nr:aldose sugar dehydrogenase YliI [uncultured archaeon]